MFKDCFEILTILWIKLTISYNFMGLNRRFSPELFFYNFSPFSNMFLHYLLNIGKILVMFQNIPNQWAKRVFDDIENLTEERIDEVLKEFIKDFKEGSLENKGWPTIMSAYIVSKAAMNSYTRILAKKYPNMCINCVCPGFVKTDINKNTGMLPVDQGAASVVRLALLPDGSPSGLFFIREEISNF